MAQVPAKRRQTALFSPPAIDSALYASVGKYAGAAVLTVFEQVGGVQRMTEWADENPGEFYKSIFTKIVSSPRQVEVTGKVTIEDAVKALDLEEGSGYTVVEPEDADISEEHRPSGYEPQAEDF
jgi:hypothetical protein